MEVARKLLPTSATTAAGDTVWRRVSFDTKASMEDSGNPRLAAWVTTLLIDVPSLNTTATEREEVAPTNPLKVDIRVGVKLVTVTNALVTTIRVAPLTTDANVPEISTAPGLTPVTTAPATEAAEELDTKVVKDVSGYDAPLVSSTEDDTVSLW
jgi:hypothetical protein